MRVVGFSRILLLFSFLTTNISNGQETPSDKKDEKPLAYSVQVDLAQIAVRVLDKNGKWVSRIKTTDLILLEDGIPQEILYIDEIQKGSEEPAAPAEQEAKEAPPAPRPAGSESDVIIVLFDNCNSSPSSLKKQKEYVKQFLQKLPPTDALFSLVQINAAGGYDVVEALTPDRNVISVKLETLQGGGHGIERVNNEASSLSNADYLIDCLANRRIGATSEECVEVALRSVAQKAHILAQQEENRSSATLQSLEEFFSRLRHLVGQKSILLISEGFGPGSKRYYNIAANAIESQIRYYDLPPRFNRVVRDMQTDANRLDTTADRIEKLTRMANASDVTLYWVNPEYGKDITFASADEASRMGMDSKHFPEADRKMAMRGLAEDTGGAALSSSNSVKFYEQLTENIHRYYLLSYKPNRTIHDGKMHQIEVKPNDSSYRVSFKKEFKDFTKQERAIQQLAKAQDFPSAPTPQFTFQQELNYFRKSRDEYRLILKVAMPYEFMTPKMTEGRVNDIIHLSLLVRDKENNVLLNEHPTSEVYLKYEDFLSYQEKKEFLEYAKTFALKPGNYTLSIVLLEDSTQKTVTQTIPLDLPATEQKCLSISPIMLASSSQKSAEIAATPTATDGGEVLYGDNKYRFTIQRVLPPQGTLNGFYQIYNANIPSVFIGFKLYSSQGLMNGTPEREITSYTDPQVKLVSNFFSLPYKGLSPGDYQLEINVREKAGTCNASSKISFHVDTQEPPGRVSAPSK